MCQLAAPAFNFAKVQKWSVALRKKTTALKLDWVQPLQHGRAFRNLAKVIFSEENALA